MKTFFNSQEEYNIMKQNSSNGATFCALLPNTNSMGKMCR